LIQGRLRELVALGLRLTGFDNVGRRNALELGTAELTFSLPDLPAAFDGYRILHVSDPHLEMFEGLSERIAEAAARIEAELCVMTGDYRASWRTPMDRVYPPLENLVAAARRPDGILAILGNHDPASIGPRIAAMGVTLLANRSARIARGGDSLVFLGVEDRHYRQTQAGRAALAAPREGFTIGLVHSPRYASLAARGGVALYLCGHTHAGQVCLPGRIPLMRPRGCWTRMGGTWRVGRMQGYTNAGAGCSVLPVRFNCPPEIARITLRREEART
jgi:predicted MPP superfamily phosphohydrolase